MTALFRRVVNVVVAPSGSNGALGRIESGLGFELSNLDAVFRAKKNLKAEPNTCDVKLYGLSRETRRVLETPKKLVLRLEAGYPSLVGQIFLGEIRSAHSRREGPEIVTEISTGDSVEEMQKARINISIGPKVPVATAMISIARSLKDIGIGNAAIAAQKLASKGIAFFGPGSALSGSSADVLTDICRSADLEWSVQDGILQILDRGRALSDKAVFLSSDTGLVGSPTVDNKGVVSATALLQPDLRPGHKVQFDSLEFKGGYRIEEVEYSGDTAGTDWYAKMSCKKY